MILPNNPTQISLDFLKKLDADKPGTYMAQPKMDGFRRILRLTDKGYVPEAKKGGTGEMKPFPPELAEAIKLLPEIGDLDCEWLGTRMVENKPRHELYIFDVLRPNASFLMRWLWLTDTLTGHLPDRIRLASVTYNPGMTDLFQQQLTDPMSEGIVIRRADCALIQKGGINPLMFKAKYRDIRELVKA